MSTTPAADEERRKMFLSAADVDALWLERNVSEQCTGGGAAGLIPQYADGPTGKFKREDLGLGWQEYPSILDVLRTVRADNRFRRDEAVKRANQVVQPIIAEAKKLGIRTSAKLLDIERGCTGCSGCVPDVRLRPPQRTTRALRRIAARAQSWAPGSLTRAELEQWAVLSLLRTAAAAVRRARREERHAAFVERKKRSAEARAERARQLAERKAARAAAATSERKARRPHARAQMKRRRAEAQAMVDAAKRELDV